MYSKFCRTTIFGTKPYSAHAMGILQYLRSESVYGIIKAIGEKWIMILRKASGLRRSPHHQLTEQEIVEIKTDILAIGADEQAFIFNMGTHTSYSDDLDKILIRDDIFPDTEYSIHPRDMMSVRAVLAHEYYGHRFNRGTMLTKGSWNDEFSASYLAAKNTPGLTEQDRMFLILDALERAKEAGVRVSWNGFMRRVIYGIDNK